MLLRWVYALKVKFNLTAPALSYQCVGQILDHELFVGVAGRVPNYLLPPLLFVTAILGLTRHITTYLAALSKVCAKKGCNYYMQLACQLAKSPLILKWYK